MKFFKLFKKELKELITLQTLGGLLVGVIMFMFLGNMMSDVGEELSKNGGSVVIADQDNTSFSAQLIDSVEASGFEVMMVEGSTDAELVKKAADYDHSTMLVLPKGLKDAVEKQQSVELKIISELKGFSMMGNMDHSAQSVASMIDDTLSDMIINENLPVVDTEYVKNPTKLSEVTVVKDNSEIVNSSVLQQFAMQQSMFIPIIVFILITFATQLSATAIANEKGDKTLETLLSAPVSRLAVLGSKMCAAAIFSLLMAGVYMIGLSSYMNGMMGGLSGGELSMSASPISAALENLGLKLGTLEFGLIGIQLFLTISIALTISMILGALAKDLKAVQGLLMPLMFITMIPYIITMFIDINSLPMVGQVLLYLIPFTHTFTASSNLLFGNDILFYGGMIYQVVALIGMLYLAVKVFSTDRIFTMTLEFKKKSKSKKSIKSTK